MELPNLDNIRPYGKSKNKSFEELCYQLAFDEYSELGKFTPIDDSGGGDGVEFYLRLHDGTIWGWQCKYIDRWSEGNGKEQIKKSLHRAYDVHGDTLKKWILCSKKSRTPDERTWFEKKLRSSIIKSKPVLPHDAIVTLEHWGDSDIINLLRKHPGIHRFFFEDRFLDQEWFKQKFSIVKESGVTKSKYLNLLHISSDTEELIHKRLGGPELVKTIKSHKKVLDVNRFQREYSDAIKKIEITIPTEEFSDDYEKAKNFISEKNRQSIVKRGNTLLKHVEKLLLNENSEAVIQLKNDEIDKYLEELRSLYDDYYKFTSEKNIPTIHWDAEKTLKNASSQRRIEEIRNIALGPFFIIRNFIDSYLDIFGHLRYLNHQDFHIKGLASKGKTHLGLNIVEQRIVKDKPAIFLFGRDFTSENPIKDQIKQISDIPNDWSFSDFLMSLNIAGRVNRTKVILLIDGLNESIHWRKIWGKPLDDFILEIREYSHILFITTYRESYESEIFINPPDWDNSGRVDGFVGKNLQEAIDRYFEYYNIKLSNHSGAIRHFQEPLYLKLFCETKQNQVVSFQNEDLFDVFDKYLIEINKRIVKELGLDLRFNKKFLPGKLHSLAQYQWTNSVRGIPIENITHGILTEEEFHTLESEDLVIFRDWYKEEVIFFTYDLLNGYLIAKYIFDPLESLQDLNELIKGKEFIEKLLKGKSTHPISHDVLRCFLVLAIKKFGLKFYSNAIHPRLKDQTLESLFEIKQDQVSNLEEESKSIVREVFKNSPDKERCLHLSRNVEFDDNHPLNFEYLSELLLEMSVGDRDITWSEFIRKGYDEHSSIHVKEFIEFFEQACRGQKRPSVRIHLAAKKMMWFLTSTNRELRDQSTKALYYYGRRFFSEFLSLLQYSLSVNDPYVSERILAAIYGITLGKQYQNSFQKKSMPKLCKSLHNWIFAKEAKYGTTHILSRGYAFATINCCLKHNSKLLKPDEILNCSPPYKFGGNREWGEHEYGEDGQGYSGPIHMDFSNYTLGSIVPEGMSYSDPPEKQKVRRQIYWRIYELGWTEEKFNDIDDRIESYNLYGSRSSKAKVERYGKKYSWIAFFEIYGLREDLDQVKDEWPEFRPTESDIDPTFPEAPKRVKYIKDDILGDRNLSLKDWHQSSDYPSLQMYLTPKNLAGVNQDWVCLNGFILQRDKSINREVFSFIRGMIIDNDAKYDFFTLLKEQDFRSRRIPRINENYYTFFDEMNSIPESTYDNRQEVSFVVGAEKRTIKRSDINFLQNLVMHGKYQGKELPDEIEVTDPVETSFEILLPVAEYNWSGESPVNQSGSQITIGKEISSFLSLKHKPQSLNMYEDNGQLATYSTWNNDDDGSHQYFTFIRKDLFEKYLSETNQSMIWGSWGEKVVCSNELEKAREIASKHGIEIINQFREIVDYN